MQGGDRELVKRFLQGEKDAVEVITDWIGRAAGPFRSRLAFQWEDIQQEIRLELVRALQADRFQGRSSLKTYVWRLASYTCMDHLRRNRRWRMVEDDEKLSQRTSDEQSPLEQLLRDEASQIRLDVLEKMSAQCREIWKLILKGHGYKQMSQRLGIAEGTLRVRALRCRRKAVELLMSRRPEVAKAQGDS